ncbi:RdgB/HAM1 family non-canonical purine NTP pyrophosphatase [Dictyoglomus thermophilum]|uniref:dITP/XTP pyrophosphatase n=2 Tax=Dictyoglomus thermophilum TaxID=14 RepID=IXTPA_DICT6|nr:RdgB/HAM1 family non-canonical purine NTP pyrophosphatase [Dictyoglomus thermophilum]B5YEU3.1 RecName: Full=dITP/XTP pyrophosphatase; AltName: Full=Non-canonical purine NTP pyrophosphatase; AltName: Full=Non-standard purine NTP pyrophosphatase; AltName: Full=Nucleoside-triphosphate diphosphatase; AltName: Full=Nucleoside-triphosphate pyrophosphatase; Short=NTPase [Dictyoglomus thermophilum H-6-12]ACI19419.1 non-canonical purine NTP pyrophosphatase, RdgB/HAM1 family [Dictyoglomus thermophilum H
MDKRIIVLATKNEGKVREILEILSEYKDQIKTLKELEFDMDLPEETGKSYEENAFIKAKYVAEITGYPVIAEDSGLEIDALQGELGIYSARFGGNVGYKEKISLVLEKMKDTPWEDRKARFICKAVFYDMKEDVKIITGGKVEGYIAYEPKGEKGFGYDPIFYFPLLDKTFGEIDKSEKNKYSHRFLAFSKLKLFLDAYCKGGKI